MACLQWGHLSFLVVHSPYKRLSLYYSGVSGQKIHSKAVVEALYAHYARPVFSASAEPAAVPTVAWLPPSLPGHTSLFPPILFPVCLLAAAVGGPISDWVMVVSLDVLWKERKLIHTHVVVDLAVVMFIMFIPLTSSSLSTMALSLSFNSSSCFFNTSFFFSISSSSWLGSSWQSTHQDSNW